MILRVGSFSKRDSIVVIFSVQVDRCYLPHSCLFKHLNILAVCLKNSLHFTVNCLTILQKQERHIGNTIDFSEPLHWKSWENSLIKKKSATQKSKLKIRNVSVQGHIGPFTQSWTIAEPRFYRRQVRPYFRLVLAWLLEFFILPLSIVVSYLMCVLYIQQIEV